MTGRSVEEWRGKTPDSTPPASVRARVFLAHNGRCHISGRPIRPGDVWELEHVRPLSMGGENRETNLAPALSDAHRHDLRRTAASWAVADGVPIEQVALMLADSVETTRKHYAVFAPDYLRGAVDSIAGGR